MKIGDKIKIGLNKKAIGGTMIANDIGKLFTQDICSFLLLQNFHGYRTGLSFNFAIDNKLCDITEVFDDRYNVEIYSDNKRIHIYRDLARDDILSTVFNIRG
jgi:hypothetical protein